VLDIEELPPIAVTTANAAKLLQVSKNTVLKMVREGRLPAIRIGNCLRIPTRALTELAGRAYPTNIKEAS
jgi:excisionase family DNA binding protein